MTRPPPLPPRPLEAPAERNDGGDDDDDEEEDDDSEAAGGPCGADESAMLGAVSFTHRHTTGADAGLEANRAVDDGGDAADDKEAGVGSSGVEKLRPSEPPDNDEAAAVLE
jgi:hypothetical protein